MLGLVELLFVFAVILGWAIFEMRGLRPRRSNMASPPDDAPPPDTSL